jgi:hypothetical protein
VWLCERGSILKHPALSNGSQNVPVCAEAHNITQPALFKQLRSRMM